MMVINSVQKNAILIYCSECYDKEAAKEIETNKRYCFKCQRELTGKEKTLALCDFCWEKDLERMNKESQQTIKNNPQNNPQWQADLVARKKRLAKLERQTQSNPSRLDSNHNSNQINTKPNNSHLGLYLLGDTTLLGSHPLGSFATPPLTIQKIDGGIFNTMYFNRFAENADNKHEPDAEAFFYFASKLNQPIQIPIRCTFLDEQNLIYWVLSDEVIEEIRTEKAK
ncbi:1065_t:CDS:2 [Entrophospora sp. SA101]|nr:1065_t:CDS:2 [Entrophospora sp. SA101]